MGADAPIQIAHKRYTVELCLAALRLHRPTGNT